VADPQTVTLTANTPVTVTLSEDAARITVVNVDGAAAVWFNINSSAVPSAGGAGCWPLPAVIGSADLPVRHGQGNTVVKLISTGTPTVTVGPTQ
jgi:hypothetical protein